MPTSTGTSQLLAPEEPGLPPLRNNSFRLLLLQSLAFFLTFMAFNAAQALNGSIAAPPGLASAQFMTIYIVFAFFSIPAPKLLSFIGPKACMAVGMLPYACLTASFLAPPACSHRSDSDCWPAASIWAVRIVAAVLVGLGAPVLWTGQGVYLARLAAQEDAFVCAVEPAERESRAGRTLKRYNGVFFTAFQMSGAAGLVGASLVLALDRDPSAKTVLFIALSLLCLAGLGCILLFLPELTADGASVLSSAPDLSAEGRVTFLDTLHLCADSRMFCIIPNIVYNGLSLAFVWYMYNTFVFNTALGASFVGFGGALGFLVNTLATSAASRLATRVGQLPTMALATAAHVLFYALLLWYRVTPLACLPSGCAKGTAGPCFLANSTTFPADCEARGVACAECVPYDAAGGQSCGAEYTQCEWLHGDMLPPAGGDVAVLLLAICLFNLGDAVWESQVPAVLQTLFDAHSGKQPPAMANLKLWQSLGIGAMFGIAQANQLRVGVLVLIVSLAVSSLSLVWMHTRVASLDSGKPQQRDE